MGDMEEGGPKQVNVRWVDDPSVRTVYATNLTVQSSEHEFILSFYEAKVPLFLGPVDEQKAQFEATTEVEARCLSRVVIAAGRFPEFMKVLNEQRERYERALGQGQGTKENAR